MSGDLAKLNETLRHQSYLSGNAPSEVDRAQIEKLFGSDMRVLQWAGRVAAYYPHERAAIAGGKAGGVPKCDLGDRNIGGCEGCVDKTPIEKLEDPKRIGKWTTANVRKSFVDFFVQKKGLTFVPSSPVVPHSDPTLLFTNAGMNQFKPQFLGTVEPGTPEASWKGASNSQKCIRAGGKHNDLDDVGKDTYHHTFFEMLGNWSFGDYFKKEAISWAWELLTEVYKIPKDRLYVTYFHDDDSGLPPDFETRDIWKQYVEESRILKGSMGDNFWEMGDTGPCGPCTEIHYDRIGGRDASERVNAEPGDPMVIEVWNLVFIQFNREKPGPEGLRPLPAKHVDTGMGLERIASVLQGVYSNYNTDAFWRIFAAIQKATGYKTPYHSADVSDDVVISYRVIADHARTISVSLADGGVPDKEGRGFVLRRIIRRAVRFGKEFMNAPVGFFSEIIPSVSEELGSFFPELKAPGTVDRLKAIILDEEKAFDKTWKTGLKHFADALARAGPGKTISGEDAWILHDRYGFPVDLTQLMAEKHDCPEPFVDMVGFKKQKETQQGTGGDRVAAKMALSTFHIDELQKRGVPSTKDEGKYVWEEKEAKVVAILNKLQDTLTDSMAQPSAADLKKAKDSAKKEKKGKGDDGADVSKEYMVLLLDSTNFYYESGGQIFDVGDIKGKGFEFKVERVPAATGGYICHVGHLTKGEVKVGDTVKLQVNYNRRLDVGSNHTATHELNRCLREVLERRGAGHVQVNQKGSLVEPDALRFDFSWNEKLTPEQLADTEAELNKSIGEKRKVYTADLALKEAQGFFGLRQMFGEKYPDPVRVVSIGADIEEVRKDPKNPKWVNFSLEFCGGTHLKSLEECQSAVITSEESLMRGIRRMTVQTRSGAKAAIEAARKLEEEYSKIDQLPENFQSIGEKIKKMSVLNKTAGDTTMPLVKKIKLREKMDVAIKSLYAKEKKLIADVSAEAATLGAQLGQKAKSDGKKFVAEALDKFGDQVVFLQAVADGVQKEHPECAVLLLGKDAAKGRATVLSVLPPPLVKAGKSAVDWVKATCGKGGGKKDKAQMGIKADEADAALQKAIAFAGSF
eukprot:Hpha_TRINITY_DN13324_c0_g1::TRINITY_DN13324_c0_g1_i1::g.95288::m.95288/K01872/AARS, alaS; alanyl-tRNA synthetase